MDVRVHYWGQIQPGIHGAEETRVRHSVLVVKVRLTFICSLHRFLQRVSRHPTLQRSTLVRAFFESTEWVGNILL